METRIFCWGSAVSGELGLGGIEEDHIVSPRRVSNFPEEKGVQDIACGKKHTLVLLQGGTLFSCGNNDMGQLGHTKSRSRLTKVKALEPHVIKHLACGEAHSLAVSEAGQVFAWGCASSGQLGLEHEGDHLPFPRMIKKLATLTVVQIACGHHHSLALTNNGEIYAWGENNYGQLGIGGKDKQNYPCLVEALKGLPIDQIAAGGSHCFVLSKSGSIFGWGKNSFGQLGLNDTENRKVPTLLSQLRSQRIKYVCCGEDHTVALTQDGGVFTFGAGMYGQLGHGSKSNEILPRRVLELMGSIVTQVACGRCHTLAYVPGQGRLYTFGLGGSGQLGLGTTTNYSTPMVVHGPWVNHCTDIAVVTSSLTVPNITSIHQILNSKLNQSQSEKKIKDTLMLHSRISENNSNGTLVSSVQSTSYQGKKTKHSFSDESVLGCKGTDQVVEMEWREPESGQIELKMEVEEENHKRQDTVAVSGKEDSYMDKKEGKHLKIYKLVCGGDHTFVLCTPYDALVYPRDFRVRQPETRILSVDNKVLEEVASISPDQPVSQELMNYLETVFGSSACLSGSYLKSVDAHYDCGNENHGIDLNAAYYGFLCIRQSQHEVIAELISSCLQRDLLPSLPVQPIDVEAMRVYLILPMCHLFCNPKQYLSTIIAPFIQSLLKLPEMFASVLDKWWAQLEVRQFKKLVQIFKDCVCYILNSMDDRGVPEASRKHEQLRLSLEVLNRLNNVNVVNEYLISYQEFYISEVTEKVDVRYDYVNWLQITSEPRIWTYKKGRLFFCDYPFVFDAQAKTLILQTDSALQMESAMNSAHQHNLARLFMPIMNPVNPYLVLCVSREHLVNDTLHQLGNYPSADLKKPLKVVFSGEEAVDAGGVRKEFFMLLLREILDLKYGMFKEYPETNCIWFNTQIFEEEVMFFLIGLVCGLAIYNYTIIDLPFPLVLYKKLLNEQVKLEDLKGLSPSTTRGLHDLLQYEGDDFEDVFLLNFEITVEVFGDPVVYELKPDGKNIPVTKENREEYVNLYVDFILNKSVSGPFLAFSRGFHKVCGGKVLGLFHAQELMTLVIGNEDYDWQVLEENTEYKDPYNKDCREIKMFWKVFYSLTLEEKKKFLLFLTGSDRIPILGMKVVKLVIQPMNVGNEHLPVAHTCFNVLDLPPYSSETVLRNKLLKAINHTEGFGLA